MRCGWVYPRPPIRHGPRSASARAAPGPRRLPTRLGQQVALVDPVSSTTRTLCDRPGRDASALFSRAASSTVRPSPHPREANRSSSHRVAAFGSETSWLLVNAGPSDCIKARGRPAWPRLPGPPAGPRLNRGPGAPLAGGPGLSGRDRVAGFWWCEPNDRYAVFPGQAPSASAAAMGLGPAGPADHPRSASPPRPGSGRILDLLFCPSPCTTPPAPPAVRSRLLSCSWLSRSTASRAGHAVRGT